MDGFFFTGFSSIIADQKRQRSWVLHDSDLIAQDLLNEFNTRRGERIGRPNFGSIIWERLGDPLTDALVGELVEDCFLICSHDDRVSAKRENISIFKSKNGIRIAIDLINKMENAVLRIENDFEVSA